MKEKDYKEFVSLVKKMREAQEAFQSAISSEDIDQMDLCQIRMLELEREVDEYLKKMESIDQRKALETENTEFDYGHNVEHYSED